MREQVVKKKTGIFYLIGVVVIIVGVVAFFMFASTQKNKLNFYNITDKVFASEVCEYNYQFIVKETSTDVSASTTSESYSPEQVGTETWGTKNTEDYDWSTKGYKVEIIGATKDVSPYYGSMSVKISTSYISDVFTDIVIKDGIYYINVKEMKSWLERCGDNSMEALSETLTPDYEYVEIKSSGEGAFVIGSIFAEDSEKATSGVTNVSLLVKRFSVIEQLVTTVLKNATTSDSLTDKEDAHLLNIDDSDLLRNTVKSSLGNAGNYYTSYVNAIEKRGLADATQVTQLQAEKDNFMSAVSVYWQKMNTSSDIFTDANLIGTARVYKNTKGSKVYEISSELKYKDGSKDITINIFCNKTLTKAESITITDPTNMQGYNADSAAAVYNVLGKTFYLLDIFGISLDNKLELSLDSLSVEMTKAYTEYINSETKSISGYTQVKDSDLADFLIKYSNIDVTSASELDKKNAECADTILSEINKITGSAVKIQVAEVETGLPKFNEVRVSNDRYNAYFNANVDESTDGLLVIDVLLLNSTSADLTVDLTKFYITDSTGNKISANNYTLLHDYDPKYTKTSFDKELVLGKGEFVRSKLYITLPKGYSAFHLFESDVDLGVVCNY